MHRNGKSKHKVTKMKYIDKDSHKPTSKYRLYKQKGTCIRRLSWSESGNCYLYN